MKKYIIPIILAIIIISLAVKLPNGDNIKQVDIKQVEPKISQAKQNLNSNIEKLGEKVKEKIIPKKEEPKEDQLIEDCKNSFKECKSIGIKKYGWSISLSETEKFYNKETAEEFYNTWSILFGMGQELELDYPIVLFAYSMKSGEISIKIPSIVICEDGELTESSKMGLGC